MSGSSLNPNYYHQSSSYGACPVGRYLENSEDCAQRHKPSAARHYSDCSYPGNSDIYNDSLDRPRTQCDASSRLQLEYEMAKNKEYALGHLKAERAATSKSRCRRQEYLNADNRSGLNRLYGNYDLTASHPTAAATSRHFRKPRANSCPPPVQQRGQQHPSKRARGVSPLPNQLVYASSSRSFSALEARGFPGVNDRYPVSNYREQFPPTYSTADSLNAAHGTSSKTMAPEKQRSTASKLPVRSRSPKKYVPSYVDQVQRPKLQNISTVSPETNFAMSSAFIQGPVHIQSHHHFQSRGYPGGIEDRSPNAISQKSNASGASPLRIITSERSSAGIDKSTSREPRNQQRANNEGNTGNVRELGNNRLRPECVPQVFTTNSPTSMRQQARSPDIDLTLPITRGHRNPRGQKVLVDLTGDRPMEVIELEDMPTNEFVSPPLYPVMLSGYDALNDSQRNTDPSNIQPSTSADQQALVRYTESPESIVPTRPKIVLPIGPPCEQQKASLFRCLADKLSSTYEFISSLVTPVGTTEESQSEGQAEDRPPATGMKTLLANKNKMLARGDPAREESEAARDCFNARRCSRTSADNLNISGPDIRRTAANRTEMENLVNDSYCPGIIQDTIDGKTDFNAVASQIARKRDANDPTFSSAEAPDDHMTLLEAFTIRIDRERAKIMKYLKDNASQEQIEDFIREYFADLNPTELNRALKSYFLAERLQDHDQVQEAKGTLFKAEVQKCATTFPNNTKQNLISYTGRTVPVKDDSI